MGRAGRERSFEVEAALAHASEQLARAGLTARTEVLAETPYGVANVELVRPDGSYAAAGSGKGVGRQSVASALFEALEHHFLEEALRSSPTLAADLSVRTVSEIASQPAWRPERVIAKLAADHPDARLRCVRFERLMAPGEGLEVPLFLVNPASLRAAFAPDDSERVRGYLRYGSNNGSASGVSETDALLHGLLEGFERDAISLALLDWFTQPKGPPLRRVPRTALDGDLRALYEHTEALVGSEPVVLDVTTKDLGVPTYLAFPSQRGRYVGMRGSGASLSAGYAVERALGELNQYVHTTGALPDADVQMRQRLENLARYPVIARTVAFDPEDILRRAQELVALPPEPPETSLSVKDQLHALGRRLENAGLPAFWRRWSEPDAPMAVVSIRAPGLEQFCLAQSGQVLLPTGRGASLARF